MNKRYKKITGLGILWTLVLGTLSHFFYQWSHENMLVGLFSPVNESVWEHLKLLFFPALTYMFIEQKAMGKAMPGLLGKNLLGLFAGLLVMLLLFYGYTAFSGKSILWVDIGIFGVCVLLTFLLPYKLRNRQISKEAEGAVRKILWILLAAFLFVSLYFMSV
ncbi:MAG: hypothetical protein KIC52_09430 [Firmicutes bacterium]|nr:hypothetical protein [Bacillota bacterium]